MHVRACVRVCACLVPPASAGNVGNEGASRVRKQVSVSENVVHRAQDNLFDYFSLKTNRQTLLWIMLLLTFLWKILL